MINFGERFDERVLESQKILLVGTGGGFDIISCLPVYYKLVNEGKEVHMANFTNVSVEELNIATDPQEILKDRLFMVGSKMNTLIQHYPSGMVSLWFEEIYQEQIPFFLITKQSINQMKQCYAKIVEKTGVDTIIFCGFGMKGIMFGDEQGCGNMLHSSMNLAAVKDFENISKLIVTIGLESTERHKVSYNSVLDNIAIHTKWQSYLGVSSLMEDDDSFLYMKHCYDFIVSKNHHERNTQIELTLLGIMGNVGMVGKDRVTPIMSHVHAFDLQAVANANKVIGMIEHFDTYDEIVQYGMSIINNPNKQRKFMYPEV